MQRRPLGFAPLRLVETTPQRLRFAGRRTELELTVLHANLFRLSCHRRATGIDPSWAVLHSDRPATDVHVRRHGPRVRVSTAGAHLELNLVTGAWQVVDVHGLEVFRAEAGAMGFDGKAARVTLNLSEREALFGLGETTATFNKRGLIREFWNRDVLGHAPAIHPGLRGLYVSIPFAVSLRDGRAAGIFWDNPGRQTWDLGQTRRDRWQLRADEGPIDLYLFTGPRITDVLERFTELTGRLPLPPRWALGYHQCRYSYASRAELERIAREFRRRRLPCDALYCDIHHLDGHRVFTFGKTYPQPQAMLAKLARQGFKVVSIVDPGVKDDPRFGVLRRGRKHDAFVKDPGGRKDFLGEVWPGRARFPDFLQARTRDWWGDEQRALLDLGVAGFWNDMNEPANFARPDKTLDPQCVHRTDHGPRRHHAVHNVYGSEMARASRAGALRHRPDDRPFVITRSGYAGVQRHALVWTGDNSSCWEHLGDTVQMLLNLGLSGVPFAGSDVGGFLDNATPELFVRWLQLAVFTPFLRNHSNLGTVAQEPWAFGPEIEGIARTYLDLRYQLLPYLYGLFEESSRTGTPIMRPLLWHHANDPVAVACGDQFFLGPNLLVAPILHQGAVARSVYLPRGEWFDFWTGDKYPGGVHAVAAAPLERIPVFVRAGALLPLAATRPFVGPREPETIFLHVWPDDAGRLEWYDDDGRTRAHERGAWHRRTLVTRPLARGGQLEIGAREGAYPGQTRRWRVLLRGVRREYEVQVEGERVEAEFVPEASLLAFEVADRPTATRARWR